MLTQRALRFIRGRSACGGDPTGGARQAAIVTECGADSMRGMSLPARAINPVEARICSAPCRQRDFSSSWYTCWARRIAQGAPALAPDREAVWGPVWEGMRGKGLHRKLWEWCAIAQALAERGFLAPGRRGLGFAVGTEPLTSLFAASGVDVLATDLDPGADQAGWADSGQHASSLAAIHWPGLLALAEFRDRVRYQNVDMRELASLAPGKFDFLWSSCAFEHLGSLEAGLEFVRSAMELVKPGGVAVHTTEYNVSSNELTVERGDNVIYRRRDIEDLDRSLRSVACGIEGLDFDAGTDLHDLAFDFPPYYRNGREHLKIHLLGYISTSFLLVIRKAA